MNTMTLSEAAPGRRYMVAGIRDEARLVNRLSSMGMICGSELTVMQNYRKQPVLIYTRDTLVAIGRGESEKITLNEIKEGGAR